MLRRRTPRCPSPAPFAALVHEGAHPGSRVRLNRYTAMCFLALFVALGTSVDPSWASSSAPASPTSAVARVRGELLVSRDAKAPSRYVLTWVRTSDGVQGRERLEGTDFQLDLSPGRYRLTVSDPRPAWTVGKLAPSAVETTVVEGRTAVVALRMHVGASIGGKVVAGNEAARRARVLAVDTAGSVWETSADGEGRYALAGLPPGDYSVFTYDKRHHWVDKSVWVPKLRGGIYRDVPIALEERAGRLVVDLYSRGTLLPTPTSVTAVSRSTGQFWTVRAVRGSAVFAGVFPGAYDLLVATAGDQVRFRLSRDVVRPRRTSFAQVQLPAVTTIVRGATVGPDGAFLSGVPVRVVDAEGLVVASGVSDSQGEFLLTGVPVNRPGLLLMAQPGKGVPVQSAAGSVCLYEEMTKPLPELGVSPVFDAGALVVPRAGTYQPPSCAALADLSGVAPR